ncbi:TPA: hypothetical protein N0F65_010002 [Lagenidium giganteum]|uniref:Mitochondrial inner membrane protease ATP23 n=1 Tax=Lagenidium giganteum TaxID=4803 RepID=A0AAV2ZAF4_9STRA|nr:TPA: hypothetical protein N0F65_010002 [Lagenidium giganteum]
MRVYECEEAVTAALQQARPKQITRAINEHLDRQSDPQAKKQAISFACIECRDDGPEGRARAFFSAPPPTVVFCANRLRSANEVEETMVHELIHAYDFVVREMDITQSEVLACSEIRSARESECYHKAQILATLMPKVEFFQKSAEWLNQRCVREHATRSTESMFPKEARRDVEKMFDQCYADRSPFPNNHSIMDQSKDLNMKDPKVRADLYMQSHGIKELFEGMCTLLLFHRPENPRDFLADHLTDIKKAKLTHTDLPFFDEKDLDAMFRAFDTTELGFITPQQYEEALRNLGIEFPTLRLPENISSINYNLFIRSILDHRTQELRNASASFM